MLGRAFYGLCRDEVNDREEDKCVMLGAGRWC